MDRQQERTWLDVPFERNKDVRALGARWDPAARSWYAPRPGMTSLTRWERLPEVLPGEDRSFGSGLFIDMIPSTSWFRNVRAAVDPDDWHRLRTMVYGRAGHRCEACGCPPHKASGKFLEAHERFAYDHATRIQALRRLICLCTWCHTVTHFGLAQVRGQAGRARTWLETVQNMYPWQSDTHIHEAFAAWEARSQIAWTLDLTVITNAGIAVHQPEPAAAPPWPPRFPDPPDSGGRFSATVTEMH
jgi:Domain of unknown function (DUF5710)